MSSKQFCKKQPYVKSEHNYNLCPDCNKDLTKNRIQYMNEQNGVCYNCGCKFKFENVKMSYTNTGHMMVNGSAVYHIHIYKFLDEIFCEECREQYITHGFVCNHNE